MIMLTVSFYSLGLVALFLIEQAEDSAASSFDQLGSLFLWGIGGALGVALLVAFIWLKLQGRKDASADYISINPSKHGH